MSARNHRKSGSAFSGQISLYSSASGYTINLSGSNAVPQGRKGLKVVAVVFQEKRVAGSLVYPVTPVVKYGGSSGVAFTNRSDSTYYDSTFPEGDNYWAARSTILTYDVPEDSYGNIAVYINTTSGPDSGIVFLFTLYGAEYASADNASGTASSTTRTSTLRKGGFVVGLVSAMPDSGTMSAYNGVILVSEAEAGSFRRLFYVKEGAQATAVTGGASWTGSAKYIHNRVAFNALGKEYM
jgi:hypothetical protein